MVAAPPASDVKVVESVSTTSTPPKVSVVTKRVLVKPEEYHRPRSVTASVFAPVTEIPPTLLALQQQFQQQQPQLPQQLSSTVIVHKQQRPQTVTASVFAPLSAQRKQHKSSTPQTDVQQIIVVRPPPVVSAPVQPPPNTMNKGYMMFLEEGSDLTSKYFI